MVTGEMVEELIISGADIIKVGIGPGKSNKGGFWYHWWRSCPDGTGV